MAVCNFEGHADLYGLGIRLGFYLLWFGVIFAAWIAPSEVQSLRFAIDVFVAAAFLALIILTARDVNSIQPVETYIVLLLMFGAYLAIIPLYFWRILVCCEPYWDPARYPLVPQSALAANLSFLLLIGALVYQYWFWFARVPYLKTVDCQEYGFFFGQLRLNSNAFVAINALLYIFLGLVCIWLLWLKITYALGFPDPSRNWPKRQVSRRHKAAHISLLRNIDTWLKLIVAIVVTAAVELTISWNNINGVNTLASVAQTIPFLIGLGLIIRILYIYFIRPDDDYDSDSEYSAREAPPDQEFAAVYRSETRRYREERGVPVRDLPPLRDDRR